MIFFNTTICEKAGSGERNGFLSLDDTGNPPLGVVWIPYPVADNGNTPGKAEYRYFLWPEAQQLVFLI